MVVLLLLMLTRMMMMDFCCSKTIRKSIATVLTVISQHQRQEVAKLFVDKKHKPLDLREKKVCRYTRDFVFIKVPSPFYSDISISFLGSWTRSVFIRYARACVCLCVSQ
jgi:hypothetical protein